MYTIQECVRNLDLRVSQNPWVQKIFLNRSYSLLSFSGPQLYNSEAPLLMLMHSHTVLYLQI